MCKEAASITPNIRHTKLRYKSVSNPLVRFATISLPFVLIAGAGCNKVAHKVHQLTHPQKTSSAYHVVELKTLSGGKTTVAADINDKGIVVGRSDYYKSHHSKAVIWDKGIPKELPSLDNGGGEADRITSNGDIIGWSSEKYVNIHAVKYVSGNIIDLGISTGLTSLGVGCDGSGNTLVTADTKDGATHTYLVSQKNVWTDIGGITGFRNTAGTDMSVKGQIIGIADNADRKKCAFLWDKGVISPLPLLKGYTDSYAYRINSNGTIAGACSRGASHFTAVIWEQGKVLELAASQTISSSQKHVITKNGQVYKESIAYGINDNRSVVGTCNNEACLWKNGSLIDLNNKIPKHLDYMLREAVAINSKGWIVCNGEKAVNKKRQAYLLIPNNL